ncbi:hypothetical protein WMY93_024951 [Mugilogobius chulae]|uniref:Uncharacterized protein n=1 Tax=Mugilogobius chulae TaxID=88201 RepID=A0AAW0N161_9GOBI
MQEAFLVHEIMELSVSEREHREGASVLSSASGQSLTESCCKSPPRMHGAKAVMAAEPPSKQDLRERPTIIVESPLRTFPRGANGRQQTGQKKDPRKTKLKKRQRRNPRSEPQSGFISHLPPAEPSKPLLSADTARGGSSESLSSAEQRHVPVAAEVVYTIKHFSVEFMKGLFCEGTTLMTYSEVSMQQL